MELLSGNLSSVGYCNEHRSNPKQDRLRTDCYFATLLLMTATGGAMSGMETRTFCIRYVIQFHLRTDCFVASLLAMTATGGAGNFQFYIFDWPVALTESCCTFAFSDLPQNCHCEECRANCVRDDMYVIRDTTKQSVRRWN